MYGYGFDPVSFTEKLNGVLKQQIAEEGEAGSANREMNSLIVYKFPGMSKYGIGVYNWNMINTDMIKEVCDSILREMNAGEFIANVFLDVQFPGLLEIRFGDPLSIEEYTNSREQIRVSIRNNMHFRQGAMYTQSRIAANLRKMNGIITPPKNQQVGSSSWIFNPTFVIVFGVILFILERFYLKIF